MLKYEPLSSEKRRPEDPLNVICVKNREDAMKIYEKYYLQSVKQNRKFVWNEEDPVKVWLAVMMFNQNTGYHERNVATPQLFYPTARAARAEIVVFKRKYDKINEGLNTGIRLLSSQDSIDPQPNGNNVIDESEFGDIESVATELESGDLDSVATEPESRELDSVATELESGELDSVAAKNPDLETNKK